MENVQMDTPTCIPQTIACASRRQLHFSQPKCNAIK